MKKTLILIVAFIIFFSLQAYGFVFGPKGTLVFTANGEGFVTDGFVDKDGWDISFDNVYVNLGNIKAYSSDGKKKVVLKDTYFVDLKKNALVTVETKNKVAAVNYQGIQFGFFRKKSGEHQGASIVMIGTARKEGRIIKFTISLDEEIVFDCKDGYVGDVIKGVVPKNKSGEVEMTFHFDHIFGDMEAEADDHINTGSVGFNYFAQFAGDDDNLVVDQRTLAEKTDSAIYKKFIESLLGLGHSGEGHSEILSQSTTF